MCFRSIRDEGAGARARLRADRPGEHEAEQDVSEPETEPRGNCRAEEVEVERSAERLEKVLS